MKGRTPTGAPATNAGSITANVRPYVEPSNARSSLHWTRKG